MSGSRRWSAACTWENLCVSSWWRWQKSSCCSMASPQWSSSQLGALRPATSIPLIMTSKHIVCMVLYAGFERQPVSIFWSVRSDEEGLASAEQVLRGLNINPTSEDCAAVRRVCQIVSTRSAHLCAATLVAVLRQIRDNKAAEKLRTTIGVDGSVYKNHQEWAFLNTSASIFQLHRHLELFNG